MEKQRKGRSRPIPDAAQITNITIRLYEATNNENQFLCNYSERTPWEVTTSARDGAVHAIRFLKIWYDLPRSVFFTAVNCLDTFLALMKVQDRYLSCLSVSCFNLAAKKHGFEINTSQLVTLSQSKCSVPDMERMSTIITNKLNFDNMNYYNALDVLGICIDIFKYVSTLYRLQSLVNRLFQWEHLSARLEIAVSESSTACFKRSTLVLAFLNYELNRFLGRENPRKSNYTTSEWFYVLTVMIELQHLCNIDSEEYNSCLEAVKKVYKGYDGRKKIRHCQKLTWRFSRSTHALSVYTRRYYYSKLKAIKEE